MRTHPANLRRLPATCLQAAQVVQGGFADGCHRGCVAGRACGGFDFGVLRVEELCQETDAEEFDGCDGSGERE